MTHPLNLLRYHVSGAIERGECEPVAEKIAGAVYTLDGLQPAIFTATTGRDAYTAEHCDTGAPLGTYPGPVVRRKCGNGDPLMAC